MRRDMAQTAKQKWAKNAGNKNRPIQSKEEVTTQHPYRKLLVNKA